MLKLFRRRNPASYRRWMHSQLLLQLGRSDRMTLGDAYENILILGGVGSGKTTGTGFAISSALLKLGLGGIVLTAKPNEVHRWRQMCKLAGREHDLIVMDDSGEHRFSFLDHALRLTGHGGGAIENLVATLWSCMKVAERATGNRASSGTEAFWEHGIKRHARAIISLPIFATGRISVNYMLEVMRELPRSLKQTQDPNWHSNSALPGLLALAKSRTNDSGMLHDIEQIESYCLREFPGIAERTRSVFEAGLYGILDLLSKGILYRLFGTDTTIEPELCLEGKVIVVNLPIATHGPIGLIAQTLFKLAFQRVVQQRQIDASTRPVFMVADEFQSSLVSTDYEHVAISRESRCVNILITQSIASLYAVLGADESGKASVDALLGLANYKFFHANGDPITNQFASDAIGKRWMRTRSLSINHAPHRLFDLIPEQPGFTAASNETTEYAVMPYVFASLLRGGPPKMQTEAILYASGRVFKASGDTFLKVTFNQGV